jgi:hypothetical protein
MCIVARHIGTPLAPVNPCKRGRRHAEPPRLVVRAKGLALAFSRSAVQHAQHVECSCPTPARVRTRGDPQALMRTLVKLWDGEMQAVAQRLAALR